MEEEGRKEQEDKVGMVLSTGAKLCCGTCMDTGDVPPNTSQSHTPAQLQPGKTGQDQLKSKIHPKCSSPNLALPSDVMSYTYHIPLHKKQK